MEILALVETGGPFIANETREPTLRRSVIGVFGGANDLLPHTTRAIETYLAFVTAEAPTLTEAQRPPTKEQDRKIRVRPMRDTYRMPIQPCARGSTDVDLTKQLRVI